MSRASEIKTLNQSRAHACHYLKRNSMLRFYFWRNDSNFNPTIWNFTWKQLSCFLTMRENRHHEHLASMNYYSVWLLGVLRFGFFVSKTNNPPKKPTISWSAKANRWLKWSCSNCPEKFILTWGLAEINTFTLLSHVENRI